MHVVDREFSLNKSFAMWMGCFLIARSLLGFVSSGRLFGLLSTTPDHNLLNLFAGTFMFWAGVWGKRTTARGWNKFLGWLFAFIAFCGITGFPTFMYQHLNANTWADNLFNMFVAVTCLLVGHFGHRIRQKGKNFMQELNWPFAKS